MPTRPLRVAAAISLSFGGCAGPSALGPAAAPPPPREAPPPPRPPVEAEEAPAEPTTESRIRELARLFCSYMECEKEGAVDSYGGRLRDLMDALRGMVSDGRRVVVASQQAPRLAEVFGEYGLPVAG